MYNGFYGLNQSPFRLTPDPAFFYVTSQHREALAGLVHSVRNRSGLAVLTGEAGTGKTTVLQVLRKWLDERRFVVAVLTNPTLSREEFYDFVLSQLAVDCTSNLKSRQLMALEQTLSRYRNEGRHPLLIVDEAHRLPVELLDEVRLLLNLETPKEKLLDIVLSGQPELMDMLRRPELRQFKQRVSCFCHLAPLTKDETHEYIRHRQDKAGKAGQTLFAATAADSIHEYSTGIPRLVNTLCDAALRIAFTISVPEVTAGIVDEAAVDLDLLDAVSHSAHFAGNGTSEPPCPEDYASRQSSLDVLASLTDPDK